YPLVPSEAVITALGSALAFAYAAPTNAVTAGCALREGASAGKATIPLSAPPRAVICTQNATRSPCAIVLVPASGTCSCHAPVVIPPPPPVSDFETSKVITSDALVARAGGPADASSAAIPTLTVVPALAKVLVPVRQPRDDDPLVSTVCEAPSVQNTWPYIIMASLVASSVA